MNNINRNKYKELDSLLWDTRKKLIAPKEAFALYERRWDYVDNNNLDSEELALIRLLIEQFGKGYFMPVSDQVPIFLFTAKKEK
jgi:hypothetical protein